MKRLIKSALLVCVAQTLLSVLLCAQQLDLKWTKGNLPTSRISAQGVGGLCLETDGNGGVQLSTCSSGGGTGTVTSFSSGNLAPLFTTSVTNSTATPSLAFTLTNAAAHTFFGNTSGVSAAPSYSAITSADLPGSITSSTSGNAATASALAANPADCVANNFAISIDAGGNLTCAQVTYGQVTGTPTLPANTTATASNFFTAYNSSTGAFTKAQPASSDLSDFPSQATNSGKFLTTNGTVLSWGTPAGGGSGTVTSFSAGNLSPLFTTSVATATSTPALSLGPVRGMLIVPGINPPELLLR